MTTENQIATDLRSAIVNGLTARSLSSVEVQQTHQPRRQGAPKDPTVFFFKVSGVKYGSPGKTDRWDEVTQQMIHVQSQKMEVTYQVSALVKRDITNENQVTAGDLVELVSDVLASDNSRTFLLSKKIGILRITDIRNPPFLDDADQNEFAPSFDVTLTYERIVSSTTPIIERVECGVYRV